MRLFTGRNLVLLSRHVWRLSRTSAVRFLCATGIQAIRRLMTHDIRGELSPSSSFRHPLYGDPGEVRDLPRSVLPGEYSYPVLRRSSQSYVGAIFSEAAPPTGTSCRAHRNDKSLPILFFLGAFVVLQQARVSFRLDPIPALSVGGMFPRWVCASFW